MLTIISLRPVSALYTGQILLFMLIVPWVLRDRDNKYPLRRALGSNLSCFSLLFLSHVPLFFRRLATMALPGTANGALAAALTPLQITENTALIESDLAFLFDSQKLHKEVQAKIAMEGYTELPLFAKSDAGGGATGVHAFIKDDLGIVPTAGSIKRATAGRIVLAWEAAQKRVEARNEAEASQCAADGPMTIQRLEYVNLCKAHLDRRDKKELAEKLMSGQSYLEKRLDQMKENNFIAETLEEVTCSLDDKSTSQGGELRVDRDGRLKQHRAVSTTQMPRNAEELRTRFKVMAHHWELVRLKVPHQSVVSDFDFKETISNHVEWLLGEDIAGYTVRDEDSGREFSMPWRQLLEFEYQIRRRAMFVVTHEGLSFAKALAAARLHEPSLQKYLYIPLGIHSGMEAARGKKRGQDDRDDYKPHPKPKGAAKGASAKDKKGAASGTDASSWERPVKAKSEKSWKFGESVWTSDGRRKCQDYNKKGCNRKSCDKVHCCMVCNEPHPMWRCGRKPKAEWQKTK